MANFYGLDPDDTQDAGFVNDGMAVMQPLLEGRCQQQ